jgi:hypothetical protein
LAAFVLAVLILPAGEAKAGKDDGVYAMSAGGGWLAGPSNGGARFSGFLEVAAGAFTNARDQDFWAIYGGVYPYPHHWDAYQAGILFRGYIDHDLGLWCQARTDLVTFAVAMLLSLTHATSVGGDWSDVFDHSAFGLAFGWDAPLSKTVLITPFISADTFSWPNRQLHGQIPRFYLVTIGASLRFKL